MNGIFSGKVSSGTCVLLLKLLWENIWLDRGAIWGKYSERTMHERLLVARILPCGWYWKPR